jgi:hypothetical protein
LPWRSRPARLAGRAPIDSLQQIQRGQAGGIHQPLALDFAGRVVAAVGDDKAFARCASGFDARSQNQRAAARFEIRDHRKQQLVRIDDARRGRQ